MEKEQKGANMEQETKAYLDKIRKTISQSQALLSQVELRRAETDRFLEAQGLTRAQIEAMKFSPAQIAAVNAELRRRGLPPLEEQDNEASAETLTGQATEANFDPGDVKEDLENRRRKFKLMKNQYRL